MSWTTVNNMLARLERVSDATLDRIGGPAVLRPLFRALNAAHDCMGGAEAETAEELAEDRATMAKGVEAVRTFSRLLQEIEDRDHPVDPHAGCWVIELRTQL